ncbi:hypothetical protein ACRAWG_08125 [Methylobacterium sp. P31]
MHKLGLISATALSAILLAAPQAQAQGIGEGAAIGAGIAGLAVGSAIGAAAADSYDAGVDYGVPAYGYGVASYGYDEPVYGGYSWGGPALAGYALAPAGYAYPATETVDTTVVREPRAVSRTVVDEGYAPVRRSTYETRSFRSDYARPVVRREYGAEYGYRGVAHRGYATDYRHTYESRGVSARGTGFGATFRARDGIRNASYRHDRYSGRSEAFRGSADGRRDEAIGRQGNLRGEHAGIRNVSMHSRGLRDDGQAMNRGGAMERGAQMGGRGMEAGRGFGRGTRSGLE